ncbi:hypothetical protein GLOTRDRAFT_82301 [Gloeophyllum trabeum ATCC 11539]|uniref:Uncharacterized protein n=1 Tax=Gloeophyllum trabeum (strain ATCC 11539 / FP-39264 / Madison 617) TaxID=670483 RepID=S7PT39_GLOTA|nr:uncharacterized protein GLOTRDRAFT_82301 [Gloeophyllum trabeum ATCC 11539]EPQ50553.1 hypothetical protein GLOTRDRAFT_82301 [Gloeophyllum trabeum ATCC 11539]
MSGDDTPQRVDKGKQRAILPEVDERAPLLGGPSSRRIDGEHDDNAHRSRRTIWSTLCAVFSVSFLLCVLIFLALVAWSYRARAQNLTPEDVIHRGLRVQGPDRVDVLNITAGEGIWVRVDGRVGLDAGALVDAQADEERDGFYDYVRKGVGRWGIRRLRKVTVDSMTAEMTTQLGHRDPVVLATMTIAPVEVPLTVSPPTRDLSWLTNVSIPILIQPTSNGSALLDFARHSWREGFVNVRAAVNRVQVHGGGLDDNSWRSRFRMDRPNVRVDVRKRIPELPGLPPPGRHLPALEELVTLKTFGVSSGKESLLLNAVATAVNPVPSNVHFASPPELPFTISLVSTEHNRSTSVPVAFVHTEPFTLTHPNITLAVSGSVLRLPSSVSPLLSAFLSRYLSGERNPIQLSTPLFPGLDVDTFFPAPHPRPQILRDVTIRDMKIKPSGPGGNQISASGTVFARAVLPRGIDVRLEVNRVWPDVLVYDGEVPDVDYGDAPPVPLPEGAFAHIKPEDWLVSESVEEEPGNEGSVVAVTAQIEDVPLEVLPGREKEFSHFVSKVIWGPGGALAGVQGVAAVGVRVHGLPFSNGTGQDKEMELTDLPFRGTVRIGKKGL